MATTHLASVDHSDQLRSRMALVGLSSYRALSQASGVSRSAIDHLRRGRVDRLRVATLQQLSHSLNMSLADIAAVFSDPGSSPRHAPSPPGTASASPELAALVEQVQGLRQECDRLQTQLTIQADALRQQVQQEAIAQLEPWLVQWPTVAQAAQQNPDLPAQKLVPLVRPVTALVQSWGVTPIETVGAEVPFDP
ncbi:MAG: helix-turn-helix domain-containing protein, partial [Cyanobacteria bacterium J06638_6]